MILLNHFLIELILFLILVIMKKLFSFLLIVVLIACSKDPVIYTLTATANPAEGGSVSPSSQQYDSGDVASVTATPSAEYVFQSWSGSASGSSPSTTVTMDSDKAVVANFVKKKYALTVKTEGEGSVTEKVIKAGVATDYNSGTVVELTAVPEGEWLFVEWTGDLTGSENPKEITIDQAKTVTAVFNPKEMINIIVNGEGEIEKKLISIENEKHTYELISKPKSGWNFVKWNYNNINYFSNSLFITTEDEITVTIDFVDINSNYDFTYETIINLPNQIIWGLDFNYENIIFTTKAGDIYLYKNQSIIDLNNPLKNNINSSGQGGLLDIKFHPKYDKNKIVYITYSEKAPGSNYSNLVLSQFRLENDKISDIQTVFKTNSISSRAGHFGSRISFSNDHIFISVGEGSPSVGGPNSPYNNAQNLSNDWGKIHRLNFDGTIPDDNPLIGSSNNVSSIFSFGHRNPQGLEFNPYNNNIVSTEHGPQGGDEVNIIVKGENYGWPIVSYGINYDDSDISGKSHNGYKEPVFYWDPSIATSQIILLKDKNHNDWFRSYLVCGMKSNAIHRIGYVGGELIEFEKINMGERVRSIVNGKDGAFYVSTDSGKIIKFSPK